MVLVKHNSKKTIPYVLIISGLLLAPIPSALVGDPQKVRISAFFPFVLITILFGIQYLSKLLPKLYYGLIVSVLTIALAGYSVLYFAEYFGVHTTQYEYKYQSYAPILSEYLATLPENTLVNIKPFYSDPLMFHAFYSKMNLRYYRAHLHFQFLLGDSF